MFTVYCYNFPMETHDNYFQEHMPSCKLSAASLALAIDLSWHTDQLFCASLCMNLCSDNKHVESPCNPLQLKKPTSGLIGIHHWPMQETLIGNRFSGVVKRVKWVFLIGAPASAKEQIRGSFPVLVRDLDLQSTSRFGRYLATAAHFLSWLKTITCSPIPF